MRNRTHTDEVSSSSPTVYYYSQTKRKCIQGSLGIQRPSSLPTVYSYNSPRPLSATHPPYIPLIQSITEPIFPTLTLPLGKLVTNPTAHTQVTCRTHVIPVFLILSHIHLSIGWNSIAYFTIYCLTIYWGPNRSSHTNFIHIWRDRYSSDSCQRKLLQLKILLSEIAIYFCKWTNPA